MADITDLLIPITLDAWRTFELDLAAQPDFFGNAVTTWRAQTPERVLIELDCNSLVLMGVMGHEAIRGGFLAYASEDWLTLRARDTYNTERILATFASCKVTFTGSSGTPATIPANDRVIIKKTGTDITYAVAGPFVVPGSGTITNLDAVCETAGSDGNALTGEITEIQDALNGVTATNTTAAVGVDREGDEPLRTRAALATGPLSPAGPEAAYEYVALTAKRLDGNAVDVTKVKVREDLATGGVTAYYASASGGSVDVGANDIPLPGTVNYAIRLLVRPQGVSYEGFSATVITADIVYTSAVRTKVAQRLGLTADDIKTTVETYLRTFISSNSMPIEGFFTPDLVLPTVGILTQQDIQGLIQEAIRANSDIEAGNPGELLLHSTTVSSGFILFEEGEVLALGTVTGTLEFV